MLTRQMCNENIIYDQQKNALMHATSTELKSAWTQMHVDQTSA